jgi:hypothetical protein
MTQCPGKKTGNNIDTLAFPVEIKQLPSSLFKERSAKSKTLITYQNALSLQVCSGKSQEQVPPE